MSVASALPATLAQLVTTWQAAFSGVTPYVLVQQGPGSTDSGATRIVCVGSDDPASENPTQVGSGSWEWPYASNGFRRENFTIVTSLQSWNGSTTESTVTNDVITLYGAATAAAISDPSLNGTSLQIEGMRWTVTSDQYTDGVIATCVLEIDFLAQIQG